MGRLIEKIEDILQPDVNMSILTLKEKLNEVIDLVNKHEKRVGHGK